MSKWESSPSRGEHNKNIWNHQPVLFPPNIKKKHRSTSQKSDTPEFFVGRPDAVCQRRNLAAVGGEWSPSWAVNVVVTQKGITWRMGPQWVPSGKPTVRPWKSPSFLGFIPSIHGGFSSQRTVSLQEGKWLGPPCASHGVGPFFIRVVPQPGTTRSLGDLRQL